MNWSAVSPVYMEIIATSTKENFLVALSKDKEPSVRSTSKGRDVAYRDNAAAVIDCARNGRDIYGIQIVRR